MEDPPKEFLMVEFFELANQEQSFEYIHEYKQLQFKVLINTKNRYYVHICFDVCNVYKNYIDEGHCNQ